MRKLIIDFGNTLQKLAIYDGRKMLEKQAFRGISPIDLQGFLAEKGPFNAVIFSSVTSPSPEIEKMLKDAAPAIILDPHTKLPIKNLYRTPETLGKDRLAAAAGANALYPGKNVLSIDAGTCVTYDFLTAQGEYLGGAISPGLRMRFRAMHTFTGRLPLVEPAVVPGLIGRTTEESIRAGAFLGLLEEIRGTVARYRQEYDDVVALLTGGDSGLLHSNLKIDIFAVPDLVLLGLNEILDENVHDF